MSRLPPSVRHAGKPATAHLPPSVASRSTGKSSTGASASGLTGRKPGSVAQTSVETPAKITSMHACDRELSVAAGAPRGFRRIDRLQWLADHGSIADHQLHAGRRLQQDWQISKIEASPRMEFGGRGSGGHGNISDAALDAGKRVARALAVLPRELRQLTELFLMPEDHPFSLERVAAIVKEDRRAAAYGIRIALSLLARHYGYAM
jgi:hypothetical protein